MTRSSGQGGRSRHVSESLEESPEPQKKSKSKSRERSVSESLEPRKKSKSKSHRHSAPVPQNYFSRHSSPVPQKYSNRRHSTPEPQKIYVIESSPESRNHKKNLKGRENEVVIDAVLWNCKIILVIVAVILSHRIHETKILLGFRSFK